VCLCWCWVTLRFPIFDLQRVSGQTGRACSSSEACRRATWHVRLWRSLVPQRSPSNKKWMQGFVSTAAALEKFKTEKNLVNNRFWRKIKGHSIFIFLLKKTIVCWSNFYKRLLSYLDSSAEAGYVTHLAQNSALLVVGQEWWGGALDAGHCLVKRAEVLWLVV